VIAEDERNLAALMDDPQAGGLGLDAVWSDDLHHQLRVALTGQRHSYFASYEGTPDAVADVLEHGQTFRGQAFPFWKGRKRGDASRQLPTTSFVVCIENHDQVGNRARGERLEHSVPPRKYRAASLFLCLCPYVPMLFMGQEWAASSPFLFFTDFEAAHGQLVTEGRRREFETIGLIAGAGGEFPDPQDLSTFERSKLNWDERSSGEHAATLALYSAALALRRDWSKRGFFNRGNWSVERLGEIVALRYRLPESEHLVLISFQAASLQDPSSPPILVPGNSGTWSLTLASEETRFGGSGAPSSLAQFRGPGVALYSLKLEANDAAV
jgi:maltooligosyltrehalose trehalohydrolase